MKLLPRVLATLSLSALLLTPLTASAQAVTPAPQSASKQPALVEELYLMGDGSELKLTVKPTGTRQVTRLSEQVAARYQLKLTDTKHHRVLLSRELGYWRAIYTAERTLSIVGSDRATVKKVLTTARTALQKKASQVHGSVTKFVTKARHEALKSDVRNTVSNAAVTFFDGKLPSQAMVARSTLLFGYTPTLTITDGPVDDQGYADFTVVGVESHDGYAVTFDTRTGKLSTSITR